MAISSTNSTVLVVFMTKSGSFKEFLGLANHQVSVVDIIRENTFDTHISLEMEGGEMSFRDLDGNLFEVEEHEIKTR